MQGQYDDNNTGLYYNTFRYYDADAGRYSVEDPIGLNGGMNLYAYANNNPINWVDPTDEAGLLGAGYGAIAGAIGGFTASGEGFLVTLTSTVAGALAGAGVGLVMPAGSGAVGSAIGAGIASVFEQAAGNVVSRKDVLEPCNYKPHAIAGAAVGGAVGGPLNKFISKVDPVARPSVIGRAVTGSKVITAPSEVAGAAAEDARFVPNSFISYLAATHLSSPSARLYAGNGTSLVF